MIHNFVAKLSYNENHDQCMGYKTNSAAVMLS